MLWMLSDVICAQFSGRSQRCCRFSMVPMMADEFQEMMGKLL